MSADHENSSFHGTAAGVNGSEKMITQRITQIVATVHIQRYLPPRFQAPGSNLSPARSRRYTGVTYAM